MLRLASFVERFINRKDRDGLLIRATILRKFQANVFGSLINDVYRGCAFPTFCFSFPDETQGRNRTTHILQKT